MYIIDDNHIEISEYEILCQKCGHDNQDDITQCVKCERYFCDFCMSSEEEYLCRRCNEEY